VVLTRPRHIPKSMVKFIVIQMPNGRAMIVDDVFVVIPLQPFGEVTSSPGYMYRDGSYTLSGQRYQIPGGWDALNNDGVPTKSTTKWDLHQLAGSTVYVFVTFVTRLRDFWWLSWRTWARLTLLNSSFMVVGIVPMLFTS